VNDSTLLSLEPAASFEFVIIRLSKLQRFASDTPWPAITVRRLHVQAQKQQEVLHSFHVPARNAAMDLLKSATIRAMQQHNITADYPSTRIIQAT